RLLSNVSFSACKRSIISLELDVSGILSVLLSSYRKGINVLEKKALEDDALEEEVLEVEVFKIEALEVGDHNYTIIGSDEGVDNITEMMDEEDNEYHEMKKSYEEKAESADESSDKGSEILSEPKEDAKPKKKVAAEHKKKITNFFSFTSTEEADSIFENKNSPTISESSQASEDEFNP
ncbi:14167_t:CDS:2, partial [Funneliformis geosporum]